MNIFQRIKAWLDKKMFIDEDYTAPYPLEPKESAPPLITDTIYSAHYPPRRGRPRNNEARNAEIANCLWRDEKYEDVAKKFKVSYGVVASVARRYGITRPRGRRRTTWALERQGNIAADYLLGHTMQRIADNYDLSPERIRQILFKAGVKSRPTGIRKKS